MKKTAIILITSMLSAVTLHTFSQENEGDPIYKKAVGYFFERKFEMAQILLQESIKKNPENSEAYSYLGDIFLYKKRYDAALNLYKKALDLNPNLAENYFRIGQVYYYKKQGIESIDNFKRSVEIDNGLKYAYYHIGLAYLMLQRDKQKTLENWETYIKIAPEDPQYENIRRVIELLRDPNFVIPPLGSDISIEEALHMGGVTLEQIERKTSDKLAGHEDMKLNKKIKDVYLDDDM